MSKGFNFSHFLVNFYGTYERGLVIIDITMACNFSAGIGPLQLSVVLVIL